MSVGNDWNVGFFVIVIYVFFLCDVSMLSYIKMCIFFIIWILRCMLCVIYNKFIYVLLVLLFLKYVLEN